MQGPVDRPSSILDPFIARMNRWDFAALPQVVRVENYGDTTEFYWLQYYKIVMKRSKAPQSVNGIKNGRIYFLQITDQATSTILADFSYGAYNTMPDVGSEQERLFKLVINCYN